MRVKRFTIFNALIAIVGGSFAGLVASVLYWRFTANLEAWPIVLVIASSLFTTLFVWLSLNVPSRYQENNLSDEYTIFKVGQVFPTDTFDK
jgi:hypothetical protein